MLFHTLPFLAFFVVFLAVYLPLRGTRWAIPVIVIASSLFYGTWSWSFLPLLWVTIVVDYQLGRMLARTEDPGRRRRIVLISVAVNLGILGYFKYWNFLVASLVSDPGWTAAFSHRDFILPLGISFYVFQSMSYVIDVYRRTQAPMTRLIDFAAFVTFFPHLIAGPIQRVRQLVPQLLAPDPITFSRVASAMLLFASGMLRKGMADALATWHDPIFHDLAKATPPEATFAIFSFGMQIYLDFSGYSEMAVALARVLGVDLIQNFNAPYMATSIRDFWRRWHISLSMWLRDYLYITIGGSRVSLPLHIRNLLVTMTICGLWHGAGWNFMLWGLLHGLYLSANITFNHWLGARVDARRWARSLVATTGAPLTYLAANYAWLYFRVPSFDDAMLVNRKILSVLANPHLPAAPPGVFAIVLFVLAWEVFTRFKGEIFPFREELTVLRALAYGALTGVIFMAGLVLLVGVPIQQFIYFNF
jgi:D-alanyl-lipoteichoic acid acyltransferase DltB (MBOAT superfamily)